MQYQGVEYQGESFSFVVLSEDLCCVYNVNLYNSVNFPPSLSPRHFKINLLPVFNPASFPLLSFLNDIIQGPSYLKLNSG